MNDKMERLQAAVANDKCRSAWDKGVKVYALELLDELAENIKGGYTSAEVLNDRAACKLVLLNGARDWAQYSWGGCSLVYDSDIAERLCTPSEYRKTRGGERRPNSREEWLDVQARALRQACRKITGALYMINLIINLTEKQEG